MKNNMGLDVIYVDCETGEVITVEEKNEREALPEFLFAPAGSPTPRGYHKIASNYRSRMARVELYKKGLK